MGRDSADEFFFDFLAQTPGHVRTPVEIADYWIDRILNRPLPAADRQAIIDYLADGDDPNQDLDFDNYWGDFVRARGVFPLITMSPSFLWR